MWASLPSDLFVGILRRLGAAAVVSSAGTCRSWRRAIIANTSFLGPGPALLLGFFHSHRYVYRHMNMIPGLPADVLTANDVVVTDYPAWSSQATGPLASRDGFVLLVGVLGELRLRLFDARSGICRHLPAATLDVSVGSASYVLITGNDVISNVGGGSSAVWILAVKRGKKEDVKPGMTYQIFSPVSGAWGPVKRSARLGEGRAPAYMYGEPKDVAVCHGGTVYWLGESIPNNGRSRRVVFAFDVLTERVWTTELPEKYVVLDRGQAWKSLFSLATSGDCRHMSLIASLVGFQMEVWVLAGDNERRWTLRRTIDGYVLPHHRKRTKKGRQVRVMCFCPRIRCLFGTADEDRLLLIPIDRGSPRLIREDKRCRDKHGRVSCYPYEMDWSAYISRMKYF